MCVCAGHSPTNRRNNRIPEIYNNTRFVFVISSLAWNPPPARLVPCVQCVCTRSRDLRRNSCARTHTHTTPSRIIYTFCLGDDAEQSARSLPALSSLHTREIGGGVRGAPLGLLQTRTHTETLALLWFPLLSTKRTFKRGCAEHTHTHKTISFLASGVLHTHCGVVSGWL